MWKRNGENERRGEKKAEEMKKKEKDNNQ